MGTKTAYTKEQCEGIFANMTLTTQQNIVAILQELDVARAEHPDWPIEGDLEFNHISALKDQTIADFVTAAAIVNEESGELIKAALDFHFNEGSYTGMKREAIQTGAMALRFLNEMPSMNKS